MTDDPTSPVPLLSHDIVGTTNIEGSVQYDHLESAE